MRVRVSIPKGAIEGWSEKVCQNENEKVSIPKGAIEGFRTQSLSVLLPPFQYQKVRLKALRGWDHYAQCQVSIPKGAIEGFGDANILAGESWFQYQKVRLKGFGRKLGGVVVPTFQYQKVRLKVDFGPR